MREGEEEGPSCGNNSMFNVAAPELAVKMQTREGISKNNQYLFTYLVNVRGVLGLHKCLLTVLHIILVFSLK